MIEILRFDPATSTSKTEVAKDFNTEKEAQAKAQKQTHAFMAAREKIINASGKDLGISISSENIVDNDEERIRKSLLKDYIGNGEQKILVNLNSHSLLVSSNRPTVLQEIEVTPKNIDDMIAVMNQAAKEGQKIKDSLANGISTENQTAINNKIRDTLKEGFGDIIRR